MDEKQLFKGTAALDSKPSFTASLNNNTIMDDQTPTPRTENNVLVTGIDNVPVLESKKEAEDGEIANNKSNTKLNESGPIVEGDNRPQGSWLSDTRLYCPVNGRSHGMLWDFDLDECPLCEGSLFPPANKKAQGDENKTMKKPIAKQRPEVLYSVEYRDSGDSVIGKEPCEGMFNVSAIDQNIGSTFEIVTILRTSVPAVFRERHNAEQLMKGGILNKPNVTAKPVTTRLTIHSSAVLQLLRRYLEEPFPLIAHHYDELDAYRKVHEGGKAPDEDATGVKHLGFLLDHFEKTVMDDILYLESDGHLAAFVVQSVETDPAILATVAPDRPKPYKIALWSLGFDRKYVGRIDRSLTVAPFEGERKIASLRLVPCEYFDREDNGKLRKRLEDNGKRWYDLLPGGQVHYSGPVLDWPKRQVG
ncbi:hypothetical protein ACHAPJ_008724 [Fusarium lateritium]